MKRSTAWFKGNVRQDVYPRARALLVSSTTTRRYSANEVSKPEEQQPFRVGQSLVGGKDVVGI